MVKKEPPEGKKRKKEKIIIFFATEISVFLTFFLYLLFFFFLFSVFFCRPFYNYWDKEDRSWRVATATAEHQQRINKTNISKTRQYPNFKDDELMEWFIKGGGKLMYAEPNGRADGTRRLKAKEDMMPNDLLIEVPLKLTLNQLTVRNIPTNQGHYLGHYMGGIFGKNQDWGLAALLIYELHKGNSSRWWPFIRTLDMHVLSKSTLRELKGTWLAETLRKWEFEAEVMMKSIDKTVKDKDHMGKKCKNIYYTSQTKIFESVCII